MSDFDELFTEDEIGEDSPVVINPADIRFSAMNLLARREHSQVELRQKLNRRFASEELVRHEVERLNQENLQSDERFAESFARQRTGRGYGWSRVQQEMRTRGLSDSQINKAIEIADVDWFALAETVYRKKFGFQKPLDLKDKAKRVRFMQYRGFSVEYYQRLF
ncbi:MAG: regulatory protein RecX [Halioglobus sp.]